MPMDEPCTHFRMDASPFQLLFKKACIGSRRFRNWVAILGGCAVCVICSYFWIDRPVALWVHAHQSYVAARDEFNPIARIPNPVILVSSVLFILLGLSKLAKRRWTRLEHVALTSSISVLVGETIKEALKWVFGRASPDVWLMRNSSPLGFREYQFHWFHGIGPFNSFPSGHMTTAAALIAVFWMSYPRFRPLYIAWCGIAAAGLVAFNFHFLGDVIAGTMLGTTVGLLITHSFPEQHN